MTRLLFVAGFVLCLAAASSAQILGPAMVNGRCVGQIYHASQVTRPARLNDLGSLTIPQAAEGKNIEGTIVINAVLCRNGRVLNIDVVKGLPFGLTESAVNKVRNARFAPAELNFHSVSQALQVQFNVKDSRVFTTLETEFTAGSPRLVEEVIVMGNRRTAPQQILAQLRTRVGDPYDPMRINLDLQSLLRKGDFDKTGTSVTVEDAIRGGVRVTFQVVELPIISEIRFLNVTVADQAMLVEGLRKHVDLRPGVILDSAKLLAASRIIEGFLRAKGLGEVKVETLFESPSATETIVTFKITTPKVGP